MNCSIYIANPNYLVLSMKHKSADISTVIIVNKSSQKTIQVKTKHLHRLRLYAALVSALIIGLTAVVVVLKSANGRSEAEKTRLIAELAKIKGTAVRVQQQTTPKSAHSYIQDIESKLQNINIYLRKRGLKGFATNAVGGNGNNEEAKLTDSEKYSLYDEYLERLVRAVAVTPMGYPHISALTSFFGYRSDPFNSGSAEFHPGIDFKGNRGDDARCTANGKVVSAGWYGGYGKCVRVAHANNIETLYGHLSRICVKVGQEVNLGDKIGEVGSTGHSTGTHLHYEVRVNGKPVNPVKFLTLNN